MKIPKFIYILLSIISFIFAILAIYFYYILNIIKIIELIETELICLSAFIIFVYFKNDDPIGKLLTGQKLIIPRHKIFVISIVALILGFTALISNLYIKQDFKDRTVAQIFAISFIIFGFIGLFKDKK